MKKILFLSIITLMSSFLIGASGPPATRPASHKDYDQSGFYFSVDYGYPSSYYRCRRYPYGTFYYGDPHSYKVGYGAGYRYDCPGYYYDRSRGTYFYYQSRGYYDRRGRYHHKYDGYRDRGHYYYKDKR